MKISSALFIAAALLFTACGTTARYASSDDGQRYQDGIYNNTPAFRTRGENEASKSETQALVEKTKESPIYLFGDKKDTVMIPQDMSATIRYDQKLGGTVVTVGENPYDWRYDLENNYGYYNPYSVISPWYWDSRYYPWSYSSWRYGWYDPWYYGGYSRWYYGGWYDPWYYGGWYDPWYYGGFWGYDPWYYHHHYCGWYGGWDPYWIYPPHHGPGGPGHKDIWYGSRHQTGSERVFTSSTSLRGGLGSRSSTVSRNNSSDKVAATRGDRVTTNRSTVVRTTPAARNEATAPSRVTKGATVTSKPSSGISAGRAESATRRPAATVSGATTAGRPSGTVSRTGVQSNHRRPAATTSGTVSRDSNNSGRGTTYRGASSATRPSSSSYERNSSGYERSSSSVSRSSSSSSSGRSSYSTGSSRSSGGSNGGGGYSRSGGSIRR